MCQVNRVSPDLRRALLRRSLAPFSDGIFSRRACLAHSLLPRVASMSANHIFHPRGSGGVAQGHQSAAARQSIQTGHSCFVQQQGTAFHLRFPSLFCACVCSWFLQRGAVLLAVGLARGYFFFFFCNKGIILDHTARAACRAGDDFSAAALQQSNFL